MPGFDAAADAEDGEMLKFLLTAKRLSHNFSGL
jgi:hypothetical protein